MLRGMADVDELARNLTAFLDRLSRGATRWAVRVAVAAAIAAVAMYLLGLAALDGPVGRIWPWFGALIGLAAVAAPAWAAWQLSSIRRNATGIVGDVRTVLGRSNEAQRVVVDTVEANEPTGDRSIMVVRNQDFGDLRRIVGAGSDLKSLPVALAALASLPARLLIGVLATLAFAALSFLFLLALAL